MTMGIVGVGRCTVCMAGGGRATIAPDAQLDRFRRRLRQSAKLRFGVSVIDDDVFVGRPSEFPEALLERDVFHRRLHRCPRVQDFDAGNVRRDLPARAGRTEGQFDFQGEDNPEDFLAVSAYSEVGAVEHGADDARMRADRCGERPRYGKHGLAASYGCEVLQTARGGRRAYLGTT